MSNKPEQDLFGDTAGLIQPAPPRTPPAMVWYWVLATVFLGLTVLPGLIDTLKPLQVAQPVGEEAEAEAARRQSLHWLDGSRTQWLEEQGRRRSRVRHWILPTYSVAMMAGFGEVQGELLLGAENWLFLKARGVTPSVADQQIIERAMGMLGALHDEATASGLRLVIVPIPRKASLASAYLPKGVDSRPHLEDLLANRLAGSDLDAIDLLPALRSLPQRRGETAYYEGDSHLTCIAMLEMAETLAHHLELWQAKSDRPSQLHDLGLVTPRTDLLHLAGVDTSPFLPQHFFTEARQCYSVIDDQGMRIQRHVEPETLPRVAWIGTSFSAFSQVSVYLSHYIGEPVVDYSAAGVNSLMELQQRLERRHDPLPEILILEVPNYQLFDWNRHDGLLGADFTPLAVAPPDARHPPEPAPSPDASRP